MNLIFFSIRIHVWLQQPSPIYDKATRETEIRFLFLVFVEVKEIYSSGCGGFLFYNGYPSL